MGLSGPLILTKFHELLARPRREPAKRRWVLCFAAHLRQHDCRHSTCIVEFCRWHRFVRKRVANGPTEFTIITYMLGFVASNFEPVFGSRCCLRVQHGFWFCFDFYVCALEEKTNACAPTPYEGSHFFLVVGCLQRGWNTGSRDVRRACLLGWDSGNSAGNPVHIRVPLGYQQHFRSQPPDVQKKFERGDLFKDVVLELVRNLHGRRPAGSNYGKEFEQVVTEKIATKGYRFQRGKRDPTVRTCSKTGATSLHHVATAATDLIFVTVQKKSREIYKHEGWEG